MEKLSIQKSIAIVSSFLNEQASPLIQVPCVVFIFDEDKKAIFEAAYNNMTIEKATIKELEEIDFESDVNVEMNSLMVQSRHFSYETLNEYTLIIACTKNNVSTCILPSLTYILDEILTEQEQKNEIDKNYAFTQALINSVNAGMIATNPNGEIQYVNHHLCQQLKIHANFLINTSIKNIIPNWNSIYKMVSAGNIIRNEETHVNTSDSSVKFSIDVNAIYTADSNINGFVIMVRSVKRIIENKNKSYGLVARYQFKDIIGKSKTIQQVIEYAQTIANSPSTILIDGESGTGKEVFAQSIHNASSRKNNAFVAINCAAISQNLIESELFGYDEGAFTGAKKGGQPGKFELANNGTLFLDEIGDMQLDMQVKLLRAIQEGSVTRVGGDKLIPVDVRIIAATNKNLSEEVEKGNFRMDLYYRISVIPLHIPALRERKGDLPSLIRYFLNQKSLKLQKDIPQMGYSDLQQLLDYDWPGNVRELENFIEQLVNFNGKISLDSFKKLKQEEQLIPEVFPTLSYPVKSSPLPGTPLKEIEKQHIINTLKSNNGNISLSAKQLQIGRNTLYLKIKKYNITSYINNLPMS